MKFNKGILAVGLLSILFLTSCEPSGTGGLPEDFDRSNQTLEITVIWHDNQSAIDKAYVEEFGRSRNEQSINRLGFAVWANPGKKPYWCRIHAVKPTKIKNSEKIDTLGHELLHCVIGTFHPEPN